MVNATFYIMNSTTVTASCDVSTLYIRNLSVKKTNSLEPRNLNEPANIVRVDIVLDCPLSQFVPLVRRSAVY